MNSTKRDVIVIGASDTFDLVKGSLDGARLKIIGYLGLERSDRSVYPDYPYLGADVADAAASHPQAAFVVAVYDNESRRKLVREIDSAGKELLTVRHSDSTVYPTAACKDGVLVAPHAIVSTRARVGRSVYVNYGALVGHDVTVGDFSFVSPGARILGEADVGTGVLLGTNVVVLPRVKIGDDARIAANTVVSRDVVAGATIVTQQKSRSIDVG